MADSDKNILRSVHIHFKSYIYEQRQSTIIISSVVSGTETYITRIDRLLIVLLVGSFFENVAGCKVRDIGDCQALICGLSSVT